MDRDYEKRPALPAFTTTFACHADSERPAKRPMLNADRPPFTPSHESAVRDTVPRHLPLSSSQQQSPVRVSSAMYDPPLSSSRRTSENDQPSTTSLPPTLPSIHELNKAAAVPPLDNGHGPPPSVMHPSFSHPPVVVPQHYAGPQGPSPTSMSAPQGMYLPSGPGPIEPMNRSSSFSGGASAYYNNTGHGRGHGNDPYPPQQPPPHYRASVPPPPPPQQLQHHRQGSGAISGQSHNEAINRAFLTSAFRRDMAKVQEHSTYIYHLVDRLPQQVATAFTDAAMGPGETAAMNEALKRAQEMVKYLKTWRVSGLFPDDGSAPVDNSSPLHVDTQLNSGHGDRDSKMYSPGSVADSQGGHELSKYKKRSRAAPPGRCHSCNIADTPEWRRGPDGARTLCNACGLHYAKLTRKSMNEEAKGLGGDSRGSTDMK
ncbi:hypothetical protein SAICODRAFT_7798 [Saitoella complicata NRRL Y-17804]|nr:uncharacterized protein SAICODRAFT_7798 [Saitoella complicata NRRL Y-17804]ODQ52764.1 hypothetical protein SAICODRAFT_7798 [Saitoella complicata NRRL Y-17804]